MSPVPHAPVDLIDLAPPPRLDVLDEADDCVGRFPVGRVFCVGRNYAEHAREMGHDPHREPPFFFMKPASAVSGDESLRYPTLTADLHHEVELVLAIGQSSAAAPAVAAAAAPDSSDASFFRTAVIGCAVGVDFTRRDLQATAKAAGRPWEAGKVFDGSASCGALRRGHEVLDHAAARIRLTVDGVARQDGTLGQMIWSPLEVLRELAALFGLRAGDLVFTGTPAGVGPVGPGARIDAAIDGLPPLQLTVR